MKLPTSLKIQTTDLEMTKITGLIERTQAIAMIQKRAKELGVTISESDQEKKSFKEKMKDKFFRNQK